MKFGRKFRMTIEAPALITGTPLEGSEGGSTQPTSSPSNEALVITNPITLQFNIQRSAYASLNTATFAIYNLSEERRNQIFQDRWYNKTYRRLILEAGYDNLFKIFQGHIWEASSARQGANIVTLITSRDGGFDVPDTKTFQTYKEGMTIKGLIKDLIGQFPNLNQGVVGGPDGEFKRPVTIDGNTFDNIQKYANGQAFIDLETVNVLNDNEVFEGDTVIIDPSMGLLETPRREDSFMQVTTLFEPRINMGQKVELKSTVLPQYNGEYKVVGASHSGIISDAVNGDCRSVFSLVGGQYFKGLQTIGGSDGSSESN